MPAHSGFVRSIAVHAGERMVMTAGDRTIQVWDLVSLTNIHTFRVPIDETRALFVDEGRQLLFSGGKGTAKRGGLLVWDLRRDELLDEREKNADVFCFAQRELLYFGARDRYVHSLDVARLERGPLLEPPHIDCVTALACAEEALVSGSRDRNIRSWDTEELSEKYAPVTPAHADWVNALATDAEMETLYSGSKDGTVKIWRLDCDEWSNVASLQGSASGSVNALCRLDGMFGKAFAAGTGDKHIRVWRLKDSGPKDSL